MKHASFAPDHRKTRKRPIFDMYYFKNQADVGLIVALILGLILAALVYFFGVKPV